MVGFSLPTQASNFLICAGDSTGAGYCPHVMPGPDWLLVFLKNVQAVLDHRYEPKFYYLLLVFSYLSVPLGHFSHIFLPYMSVIVQYFCFFCCVRDLKVVLVASI